MGILHYLHKTQGTIRLQALENNHMEPLNMLIVILSGDEPTEDQQRQIDEGERKGK